MLAPESHVHSWLIPMPLDSEAQISCKTCGYVVEGKPLSSHEVIQAVYISTQNAYHSICYSSDSGGVQKLQGLGIEDRLYSLDILTMNNYRKEITQIKKTLLDLYQTLLRTNTFRISEINLTTVDGCHLEVQLGFDLEYHDRKIREALIAFSHAILEEDGYPKEEAEAYLALQNPPIAFKSYYESITY